LGAPPKSVAVSHETGAFESRLDSCKGPGNRLGDRDALERLVPALQQIVAIGKGGEVEGRWREMENFPGGGGEG
jgi:hypothetical protein